MHDRQSTVQRELAEYRLSLRLKTVDVGRVRIVQLKAECRKLRIADDDLEIFVIVVERIYLRAQMPREGGVLPASLVVRQLLSIKRRRSAQTHWNIQTARAKTGRNESVKKVVRIDGPVQGDLARRIRIFLRLLISQRQTVLLYLHMVGSLGVGVACADLELQAARQLKAHLTEAGDRRGRIGALQAVLGELAARRSTNQEIIVRDEIQIVVVCIGSEYPSKKTMVRRDDVELLGPECFPDIVRKISVSDVSTVQISL